VVLLGQDMQAGRFMASAALGTLQILMGIREYSIDRRDLFVIRKLTICRARDRDLVGLSHNKQATPVVRAKRHQYAES
jgi:hypothetical protein